MSLANVYVSRDYTRFIQVWLRVASSTWGIYHRRRQVVAEDYATCFAAVLMRYLVMPGDKS